MKNKSFFFVWLTLSLLVRTAFVDGTSVELAKPKKFVSGQRMKGRLESNERSASLLRMSTAQKIFVKAQTLPEQTKDALLKPAEKLAANGHSSTPQPKSQFGSARGLIQIGPDFDEPLEDFKSYME